MRIIHDPPQGLKDNAKRLHKTREKLMTKIENPSLQHKSVCFTPSTESTTNLQQYAPELRLAAEEQLRRLRNAMKRNMQMSLNRFLTLMNFPLRCIVISPSRM